MVFFCRALFWRAGIARMCVPLSLLFLLRWGLHSCSSLFFFFLRVLCRIYYRAKFGDVVSPTLGLGWLGVPATAYSSSFSDRPSQTVPGDHQHQHTCAMCCTATDCWYQIGSLCDAFLSRSVGDARGLSRTGQGVDRGVVVCALEMVLFQPRFTVVAHWGACSRGCSWEQLGTRTGVGRLQDVGCVVVLLRSHSLRIPEAKLLGGCTECWM